MSWSLGEIRALALKASRGAGLEWGQAEELSHCVFWLQQRNLPGVEALADYLQWRSDNSKYEAKVDPVLIASAIFDHGDWRNQLPETLCQPLLLIPAIASTLSDETVVINWLDNKIQICKTAAFCQSSVTLKSIEPLSCHVEEIDSVLFDNETVHRLEDSDVASIKILLQFAHHTYAPATEQSRSSGAGGGDDGND